MSMMLNLTYFSPKIEKRASLIDGRGLFATAAITKGEVQPMVDDAAYG